MPDDLDDIFDSVTSGGEQIDAEVEISNADIHMGDDDEDFQGDLDESVSDETDTDEDDEDIDSEDADEADDEGDATEFDFESVKDQPVSVTVNGETFEVPLAELRNGYMRQADYTRKTQLLAADAEVVRWAKVLREEIQANPEAVINTIAQQFGVKLANEPDPWQELVENDPSLTPLVERIRQQDAELADLRRQSQTIQQRAETDEVQAELNAVQAKYPDFNPQQVIPVALQHGVRLEAAYKIWKADQLSAESAAAAEARQKAEEAAARREKARKAKKSVSSGASKAHAKETDAWQKFDSFEELFTYEITNK